jgi:2'-hydroxyisoflavone reductase
MKILILGGTLFLGRHLAERAIARGHELTLLNRGRHNPDLFPGVEKLRGDRDADGPHGAAHGADLSALHGRQFDAVIDTCGYAPAQMHSVVAALGVAVPYYQFISTISVYGQFPGPGYFDEDTPVAQGEVGYGAAKARCEEILEAAWPGRVAHVRPGLIVGPHDPTDRFTYWPRRVAQGGKVLAPGVPETPVQWIDARDLANWCIHLCEQHTVGRLHAVGPAQPTGFGHLLERCRAVTGSDAQFCWISDECLLAQGVAPWTELPLWLPQNDPQVAGMLRADNRRALAAGLLLRPLDETLADTLAWERIRAQPLPEDDRRVKNLTPAREAQLLAL